MQEGLEKWRKVGRFAENIIIGTMKNNILLMFVLSLFFASCSEKDNDLKDYNLTGNVKSIKVCIYDAKIKFGEIVTEDIDVSYTVSFDNEGMVSELSEFDNSGNLDVKTITKRIQGSYDSEISTYDNKGNLRSKRIIKRDEDRNVVSSHYYYEDSLISFTEFENVKGKPVKSKTVSNGSTIINILHYENGIHSKTIEYDIDGNETGNFTELTNGRLSKICKNSELVFMCSYNDKNLPCHIVGGKMSPLNWFYVDTNKEYYYEYEYDKKGNWIKRIEYYGADKKLETVSTREIAYY